MEWNFDQWTSFAGVLGGLLLLGTYWLSTHGVVTPRSMHHRGLQLAGALLLVAPMCMKWYYSESLIMLLAISLCAVGGFEWLRRQMK